MEEKKFEKIVKGAINEIPRRFLGKLNNVDICVEDKPNLSQLGKLKARDNSLIFGLYEGVPQTERRSYGGVLPDKITIFKNSVEKVAKTKEEIKKVVKKTVWHEIAHHFGMDEKRVRDAERKRRML